MISLSESSVISLSDDDGSAEPRGGSDSAPLRIRAHAGAKGATTDDADIIPVGSSNREGKVCDECSASAMKLIALQGKKRSLVPKPSVIVISDDAEGENGDDPSEGDDDVLMHSDESRTRTVRWVCWVGVSVAVTTGSPY